MSTQCAGGHYDATMQLYVDGELLPREAAKISTFNHGLRYGDGVFERAKSGRRSRRFLRGHLGRFSSTRCRYVATTIQNDSSG